MHSLLKEVSRDIWWLTARISQSPVQKGAG
jgi:hypothetical protein